VDDAFRYLTLVVELRDDRAIHGLNEKLAQGRLRLHWRRTDPAGKGQKGDVPSVSWQSGMLRISRDFNRNEVDWATGQITTKDDCHAFVASETGQPGHTYELTVSARDVRMQRWQGDAQPIRVKLEGPVEVIERRDSEPPHHRHIREIADKVFPEGWGDLRQARVLQGVGNEFEKRGEKVPERQMLLRALGYRKN
jgi:hypothetical protein